MADRISRLRAMFASLRDKGAQFRQRKQEERNKKLVNYYHEQNEKTQHGFKFYKPEEQKVLLRHLQLMKDAGLLKRKLTKQEKFERIKMLMLSDIIEQDARKHYEKKLKPYRKAGVFVREALGIHTGTEHSFLDEKGATNPDVAEARRMTESGKGSGALLEKAGTIWLSAHSKDYKNRLESVQGDVDRGILSPMQAQKKMQKIRQSVRDKRLAMLIERHKSVSANKLTDAGTVIYRGKGHKKAAE